MNNSLFLYGSLLLLLCCSACADTSSGPVRVQREFFDLKGYFVEEATRLASVKQFRKTVTVNEGKGEEKVVDDLDLEVEFKAFRDADINRAGWIDEYQVDSLKDKQGQLQKLSYVTDNEKLKTKELTINYREGKVSKIVAKSESESMVASLSKRLVYKPTDGYQIESRQSSTSTEEFLIKVDVAFLK